MILYQVEDTGRADSTEDGGMAKIFEPDDTGDATGMFVRVQSWSDEANHEHFDQMLGKRVRITVEILD